MSDPKGIPAKHVKEYLFLLVSMMLNTLCSRIVNIIDLSMMKEVSSISSAAFLLLNNITFIDYVFAMTFIPVLGVILSRNKDKDMLGNVFKYGFKIIILASLLCLVVYPLQITFSIDNQALRSETMAFEIVNIIYIPIKMMQFMMGNFLSVFMLSKYVSIYSILSIPLDFILNKAFIYLFGPIGCLFSTLLISIVVCIVYFHILNKRFSLIKQLRKKGTIIDNTNHSFLAEFMRILFEKGADFVLFGVILINTNPDMISNIGFIISYVNLFLVQSTMSMRSIAITIKNGKDDNIPYLGINLAFATIISIISILAYGIIKSDSFGPIPSNSTMLCIPVVILVDSISSVMRGHLQARLKFKTIFYVESIAQWIVYIPTLFFLSKSNKLDYFPISILALNSTELISYTVLFLKDKSKLSQ